MHLLTFDLVPGRDKEWSDQMTSPLRLMGMCTTDQYYPWYLSLTFSPHLVKISGFNRHPNHAMKSLHVSRDMTKPTK